MSSSMPRKLTVVTKSFYTGVAAQNEKLSERLQKMDREITDYIDRHANLHPSTKIMITSAMGENVYAVTVVITSSEIA